MERTHAAAFVEENLKTIFAYALSRVSNRDDAEDLTNDIAVAILQSAEKIKDPDAFYGYIWGIAANTYKKFMRRKNRRRAEAIDENLSDGADFTEELLAQQETAALRREIALLSKEYRECTVAYYYDGLSCAEVSEKLRIPLDMVKYYLFKTRKILKEGISMEREFGEKSFHPAPFEFLTIFSGESNREYQNLFSRKLPGQILLSAYYTPMTARALAIELGVASVYLEDELALLEKYRLVEKLPSGKYQTRLVIFTQDFTNEFYRSTEKVAVPALKEIIAGLNGKLEQVRQINACSEKLSDSRLLWSLLWPVMLQGHIGLVQRYPRYDEQDRLYDGATGVNYGLSLETQPEAFASDAFAGYAMIDEQYRASAADFGVLPEKNRFFTRLDRKAFAETIRQTAAGQIEPTFLLLTEAEEQSLFKLLRDESALMASLYDGLFACACKVMKAHAPKRLGEQVDRIMFQTLFFRTVGLIGGCAVQSGLLALPDFDGPAAMYVREDDAIAADTVVQSEEH